MARIKWNRVQKSARGYMLKGRRSFFLHQLSCISDRGSCYSEKNFTGWEIMCHCIFESFHKIRLLDRQILKFIEYKYKPMGKGTAGNPGEGLFPCGKFLRNLMGRNAADGFYPKCVQLSLRYDFCSGKEDCPLILAEFP